MGFYRLYKIIKDFLKQPVKTVFIFIVILIIISIFSGSVFASTDTDFDNPYQHDGFYDVDTAQLINSFQEGYLASAMNVFYKIKTSGTADQKRRLNNVLAKLSDYYYYCEMRLDKNYPTLLGRIYLYNSSAMYNAVDINTHFTYLNDYVTVPVAAMNVECLVVDVFTSSVSLHSDDYINTKAIPFSLFGVRNAQFDDFCNNFNNKSSNDLYSMLESINQKVQETNDFLKDNNIDNSNVQTPSQPSQSDPTESGFNNIFNSFKNAFTDDYETEIAIPIPFANKNIYLSSYFIKDRFNSMKFIGNISLSDFVHLFWWFLFSLYIVKDVEKTVEKIKSGDIATSSETNIKTEML